MSDRRGVIVARPGSGRQRESVRPDDLRELMAALDPYDPEPVGFVLELDEYGVGKLPAGWEIRSRWWLDGDEQAPAGEPVEPGLWEDLDDALDEEDPRDD